MAMKQHAGRPCLGRMAGVPYGRRRRPCQPLSDKLAIVITAPIRTCGLDAPPDLLTGFLRLHALGGPHSNPSWVDAAALPDLPRQLLVHDHGMTATLEAFWGQRMHLAVLHAEEVGNRLQRHVLLSSDGGQTPAELGLIEIHLDSLPPGAVFAVKQRRIPFGAILSACGVAFKSEPVGFLKLPADQSVARLLHMTPGEAVYGRVTTLYAQADGRILAHAVELLSSHSP